MELPSTRVRINAMSERIWNPDASKTYADFALRAQKADELLDRLIGGVAVRSEGTTGQPDRGYDLFNKSVTVSLSAPAIGTIHYTLDGKEPTTQSPRYESPITITAAQTHHEKLFFNHRTKRYMDEGNICTLKARIFNSAGKARSEKSPRSRITG